MLDHGSAGILLEGGDAQIAIAAVKKLRLDALHLDDFARERHFQRFGFAFAEDGQSDLRLRLAAHAFDGFVQCQAFDERVVDLEDHVARFDAGTVGGSVLDRRDDLHQPIFHTDFDADSAEFALRADLQVLEGVGVEVAGVRVQVRKHAADGVCDQFLVLDRLDIALLDGVEHLGEGSQFFDR